MENCNQRAWAGPPLDGLTENVPMIPNTRSRIEVIPWVHRIGVSRGVVWCPGPGGELTLHREN